MSSNNGRNVGSSDNIIGTKGNDVLVGTAGDDILNGDNGNDMLFGGDGNDTVNGDNHDDFLYGEAGDDTLDGGNGNDWLDGGTGNDTLIGGNGTNVFAFGADSGTDVVTDFSTMKDTINLVGSGIYDMSQLTFSTDANGNAVMDMGNGNTVTFNGVTATELQASASTLITFDDPPAIVQLGIDDTYTDAGDGTDQTIDGDNQGEELTDTDTFVFTQNFGSDTVTDFQINTLLPDFTIVPGDILDLSAHGVVRTSFGDGDTATGVLASYGVTLTAADVDNDGQEDSILTFADGSELTLLGIDTVEDMQIIIELQLTTS